MHAGEINLHRLINADRALDRQLPAPAPPPPSFCVGNLQRRQTPFSWRERGGKEEEERKKGEGGDITEGERERERERGKEGGSGGSWSECGGRGGAWHQRRRTEGGLTGLGRRVERWLARQESDSPLIGSIGHCQRRIFSCSLTGRAVRMIAHLSAQKTNKNKPLLI